MGTLPDRLDELYSITQTFVRDVDCFRERCNISQPVEIDGDDSAVHRAYVRAVFALIEGLLHQHINLLLDLSSARIVQLDTNTLDRLREEKTFMSLKEKVKVVYKAAGAAFNEEFHLDFSTSGWRAFGEAIKLRNRITHPKSFLECGIQVWDVEIVEEAEKWFRGMHNEYVRLARTHREATRWEPST